MIFSIIYACFKERINNPNNFFQRLLLLYHSHFFPLQNTNSFWTVGNLFIWFSLAFAISHVQTLKQKENKND